MSSRGATSVGLGNDAIGKVGETVLPGYKYAVIWSGLYTTWGNELDWTYKGPMLFYSASF